ncbi:hypothetical protein XNC3_2690013 [Xenorhabdus nematophila F1]|nr:hypothetical protein XNC3_2690013 [Xenorhabdus nematophila F1]
MLSPCDTENRTLHNVFGFDQMMIAKYSAASRYLLINNRQIVHMIIFNVISV